MPENSKTAWCYSKGGLHRAISDILLDRSKYNRVMFVRMDDGPVEGVFATDGYVSADDFDARQIAQFIEERVEGLSSQTAENLR